jgi:hypothetical protein
MKGELTYNIEVLNARLVEVNKLIVNKLKEESDGKPITGQEDIPSNGGNDNSSSA